MCATNVTSHLFQRIYWMIIQEPTLERNHFPVINVVNVLQPRLLDTDTKWRSIHNLKGLKVKPLSIDQIWCLDSSFGRSVVCRFISNGGFESSVRQYFLCNVELLTLILTPLLVRSEHPPLEWAAVSWIPYYIKTLPYHIFIQTFHTIQISRSKWCKLVKCDSYLIDCGCI